jgi:putative membrane protein
MEFAIIKSLHIIFVVTWFSGLFYIVRLFIYRREAQDKPEPEKSILDKQFAIMSSRLWFGITWPSAVLTLIFGSWMFYLYASLPSWLILKLVSVAALYVYHFTLQRIFVQQKNGVFKWSSAQLRMWNELATLFLFSIVFLVIVKEQIGFIYGLAGLIILALVLYIAIKIYKRNRRQ